MVSIITGNYEPPSQKLDPNETQLFDESFDAFSTLYDSYGQAPLSQILQPYKKLYQQAAEIAKKQFKGSTFGGLMNNSGFNLQMIRATTVRTQSASSQVYTWSQNITSTGWQSMFGTQADPYTTGISSTLGTNSAAYTQDRVNLFITHLLSHTPPKFDEVQFGVGTTKYNVFPTTYERISDIYVTKLPEPMFIPLNSTYFFLANYQRTGTDDTQLLGAAYVLSSYASLQ